MLSIPATGCSSEAAGRSGGMAGLLYSAALQAGLPAVDKAGVRRLTAEEVQQILIGTADNFYDPNDATDPTKYPTAAPQPNGLAFAHRFGYGRPNARSAVDAIFAGRLPPEVDIRSPGWFDTIYQDKTPSVTITTHFGWHGGALPAGTTMDWVIEWAPGVDPTDDKYTTIGHAEMSTMVGDITQPWDVSSLTVNNPVPSPSDPSFEPDDPANKYIVTLRARAVLHSSNPVLEGVKGESRHAVSIYKDPDLVAGFPMFLGDSGEGSPKIASLLGDGKRQIVFADTGGKVHAISADGSELPGWPVKTETLPFLDAALGNHAKAPGFSGTLDPARNTPAGATAAIGDIDGDGKPEVVVATWFGSVWAWHTDGSVVAGFPVQLDRDTVPIAKDANHELQDGFFASPTLVDLDKDKKLEIVAAGMDGKLYAWHGDGSKASGFPVIIHDTTQTPEQRQRIMGSPAAGNLNGDGVPDIVVGTNEDYSNVGRVYAVDGATGAFLPGWPLQVVSNHILPVVGKGVPCAPAMADVDGNGVPEVLVSGIGSVLHVFDAHGKAFGPALVNQKEKYGARSNARNPIEFMMVASPSVGDLDNDGTPDLVEGGAGSDALLGVRHRRAAPRLRASRRRVGRQDRQVQERLSAGHRGLAVLLASGDRRRRRRRQARGHRAVGRLLLARVERRRRGAQGVPEVHGRLGAVDAGGRRPRRRRQARAGAGDAQRLDVRVAHDRQGVGAHRLGVVSPRSCRTPATSERRSTKARAPRAAAISPARCRIRRRWV